MSHVDDRFSFNGEPPSPDDIVLARNAIAHNEEAISTLEKEIQSLLRDIRHLRHKQSHHQERIRYFKGVITLAVRLPSELLAAIFEHCAHDGWTRAPLVVSQVCSAWRRAAKIPTVWSHLYVDCESKDPLGRTRHWLENAIQAPLHITMVVDGENSRLPGVMDLLLNHMPQWRNLTIISNPLSAANYILSRCTPAAPELSSLNVTVKQGFNDESMDHDLIGFAESFKAASQLSTVYLTVNLVPSRGVLPSFITSLFLTLPCHHILNPTLSATSVIALLEGLTLLRHLEINFPVLHRREFIPEADGTRIVSVPDLHTLALVVSPDVTGILPHIHAPALRRLHLCSSEDPLGHLHRPTGLNLLQFLERAEPQLEFLELYDIDLAHDHFASCFSHLNSLKELRLHETEISDPVMHLLDGPAGLCPRLTRLDLRWCESLTGRALVRLVQSRRAGAAGVSAANPIAEVTVINSAFVKEEDIVELSKMTVCRIIMRDSDDYCHLKGCCYNERYRQRLRLRYMTNTSPEERSQMQLVASW